MTLSEEKARLRAEIRKTQKQLSPAYCRRADAAITRQLLVLPEYQSAGTVFCFVSTPSEIDTRPVLEDVLASGKQLAVPLCVGDGIMELRLLTQLSFLHPGAYGILEPEDSCPRLSSDSVDFSIIPCLSCDHAGRRLGKGGGFYDRFLSAYRAAAVLVCRERLVRAEIPIEPHDCPIHWVLTENGLYEDGVSARLE